MTLEELLKNPTIQTRIECGGNWMYWDDTNRRNEWAVLYRAPYARNNTVLYRGDDLQEAIKALTEAK